MAIFFDVVRDGSHFSARADGGGAFPIGSRVAYRGRGTTERHGLSNDRGCFGSTEARALLYLAADHAAAFPYWSDLIEPTAICEGQSFLSLNSYDRASFTFGFGQFAAHVPEGDFVHWFRAMLALPNAADYFPELAIVDGRIARVTGGGTVPLEDHLSTERLQRYLNPTLTEVEDAEVIAAARLIHWTTHHADARDLQVAHMVATQKQRMIAVDKRLGLNGVGGDLCCVILDVRHQGRAGYDDLQAALLSPHPYDALLEVGGIAQPGRVKNLKAALATRRAGLARRHWSRAHGDFVPN